MLWLQEQGPRDEEIKGGVGKSVTLRESVN